PVCANTILTQRCEGKPFLAQAGGGQGHAAGSASAHAGGARSAPAAAILPASSLRRLIIGNPPPPTSTPGSPIAGVAIAIRHADHRSGTITQVPVMFSPGHVTVMALS